MKNSSEMIPILIKESDLQTILMVLSGLRDQTESIDAVMIVSIKKQIDAYHVFKDKFKKRHEFVWMKKKEGVDWYMYHAIRKSDDRPFITLCRVTLGPGAWIPTLGPKSVKSPDKMCSLCAVASASLNKDDGGVSGSDEPKKICVRVKFDPDPDPSIPVNSFEFDT